MDSYKQGIDFKAQTHLKNKDGRYDSSRELGLVPHLEVLVDGNELKAVEDRNPELAGDPDTDPDAEDGREHLGAVAVDFARNA